MSTAAVIGLGTMGAGIAAVMARAGHTVRAYDIDEQARSRAAAELPVIAAVLDRLEMPAPGDTAAVTFCDSLAAAVADADLVVENIPEKLELKLALLREVEPLVSDACVLASDTSGLPIGKLQEATARPSRVVGMHWSNPPHIIPIIEVIAGEHTSPAVAHWMLDFVTSLNLLPIEVKKDVPGFVENRILYAIMREAVDLVERGVIEPQALDTCVRWGIGYKLAVLGPMALLDMAGLDIYESVSGYLNADLARRTDVSPYVRALTEAGRLGIKAGNGIYDYDDTDLAALRAGRARLFVALRRELETGG